MVLFENVNLRYGDGPAILQQVSFTLAPGSFHFIVGASGAGKSSLLRMMYLAQKPTTGRVMEVWSTEPGLQFYSGNFLDGKIKGKGGWVYQFRNGFCMEPQHYPDSPNKPEFPSVVLKPGQTFLNTIVYRFSAQ